VAGVRLSIPRSNLFKGSQFEKAQEPEIFILWKKQVLGLQMRTSNSYVILEICHIIS